MPTIPLYGDNRVQETDLKRTPLSTETPSIGAFGGGERLAQGAGMVEKIILDAKKEADEVAVQDFDNNLALINKELSSKALSKVGKDAFNLPDEIAAEYDEKVSKLEKNLSGAVQRGTAKQRAFERKQALLSTAEKHSNAEITTYKTSVYKTGIAVDREEALLNSHNPLVVEESIAKQHQKLDKLAEMSAEVQGQLPMLKLEAQSKTYTSIMEKKINAFNEVGGVEETQKYFEAIKGKMTESDALKVGEELEKAALDYKGLVNSDKLFEKYKYSPMKAQEELQKIKDPAERKITRDYFNQAMGDFQSFENMQQKQTERNIYNKIKESKGDLKQLRPMLRTLDARDQKWFEDLAQEERNGTSKNRVSDPKVYYKLVDLMKTPEGFKEFESYNLLDPEFVKSLSTKHWDFFDKAQREGYNGAKTSKKRDHAKILDSIYVEAGYKLPTGKNKTASKQTEYNAYLEAMEDQLQAKENATSDEVREIARKMVQQRILNRRPIIPDVTAPNFNLRPELVDIDDLDDTTLNEMKNDFEIKRGRVPTEDEIKRMYVEGLKRGVIE